MRKFKSKNLNIKKSLGLFLISSALITGVSLSLVSCSNTSSKIPKERYHPSQGKGEFLNYDVKKFIPEDTDGLVKTFSQFSNKALKDISGVEKYIDYSLDNVIGQWFKDFKDSPAYKAKFEKWEKEINEEWDNIVKDTKKSAGDAWAYEIQNNYLDQVGGNVIDWKRNKMLQNINALFDTLVFKNDYLAIDSKIENQLSGKTIEEKLFSSLVVNGANGVGTPNNIVFSSNNKNSDKLDNAFADLQSFIFDEYVEKEMPLVTSMVLFKQEDPKISGASQYFNIAETVNKFLHDPIPDAASYSWQVFRPAVPISNELSSFAEGEEEVPPTEGETNSSYGIGTRKYLNFINDVFQPDKKLILNDLGGAININTSYTDDSGTLYYIKRNDVFNSSFTQYAAAASYKYNNLVHNVVDPNLPIASSFKTGSIENGLPVPGTEIMSNFFNLDNGFSKDIPLQVQDILNSKADWKGKYNGLTTIADSVNITGTPFILTRDEAGVHIIGIDRYDSINQASSFDGKVEEIKNTIKWRALISKMKKENTETVINNITAFDLDLNTELSTFYTANRNEILTKYILKNQTNSSISNENYIFSDFYTVNVPILNSFEEQYISTYYAWKDYKSFSSSNNDIKNKLLGIQDSYLGKYQTNSVVDNGITGILPYSRNTVVGENFGQYDSLNIRMNSNSTYSKTVDNDLFSSWQNAATIFSNSNTLQYKELTFDGREYSQYVQVGIQGEKDTLVLASNGEKINSVISSYIQNNEIKTLIESQNVLSYLNESSQTNNFDYQKYWLKSSDIQTEKVNNQLLRSSLISTQIEDFKSTAGYSSKGTWNTYDQFLELAYKNWIDKKETTLFNNTNLDFFKRMIGYQYGLDWNTQTNKYEFTKFRDYLLDATKGYKNAAFVWSITDNANNLNNYGNNIQDDFSFNRKPILIDKSINGYAYPNSAIIEPEANGLFNANEITFTTESNYWNAVPLTQKSNIDYTGYNGMQFGTQSTIDTELADAVFKERIRVLDRTNADVSSHTQGTLYNLESRENLINEIEKITLFTQLDALMTWLKKQFKIDDKKISQSDIVLARTQLINIVNDVNVIPNSAFERIIAKQLANDTAIQYPQNDIKFFGQKDALSQVIITQFNYNDVVKLFDTDNNNIIDTNDNGINWTYANANGFLGVSEEAFFSSLFQWLESNSANTTIAFNAMVNGFELNDNAQKMTIYDIRFKTMFGKKWVKNYLEENKE